MQRLKIGSAMLAALWVLAACQGGDEPAATQTVGQASVTTPAVAPANQSAKVLNEATPIVSENAAAPSVANQAAVAAATMRVEAMQHQAEAQRRMAEQIAAATAAKKQAAAPATPSVAVHSAPVVAARQVVIEPAPAPVPVASPQIKLKAASTGLNGDAAKGKVLARKCAACHDFGKKNKMGPGLAGVFGRQAASVAGFKYKYAGFIETGKVWSWDEAHLAAWICDSKKAVQAFTGNTSAKTRMGAQRICDTAKQADLIAYLKTL
ncbi:MAG: hypothetical protein Q9M30_11355 [Mariprofundaceae bacterium]|nr:hypothetical protein [Mariprofundaceae bacterium]